jgi:hypothetical protein
MSSTAQLEMRIFKLHDEWEALKARIDSLDSLDSLMDDYGSRLDAVTREMKDFKKIMMSGAAERGIRN